jgi:SAM-dependent methyltransferase
MTESSLANAQQIEYWNTVTGPKWVSLTDLIDAQIAPIGLAAIDAAAPRQGERVLDVGCGCGPTTLELARRVGAAGSVSGVDISRPMLAEARRRAAGTVGAAIDFTAADAQTHAFEAGAFDLIFSRFGVMFFEDPRAAFANLHRALRTGGRLAFACWQEPGRNPWMVVPAAAAAKHIALPPPADPHAPGPFAFADAERVRGIIESAGFERVSVEPIERTMLIGAGLDLDRILDFVVQMGPAAVALRDATTEVAAAVRESIREAVKPHYDGTGLRMDAAAWCVTARRAER